MRAVFVMLLAAFLTTSSIAQDKPAPPRRGGTTLEDVRRFADAIMQKIGNDEMAGAFEIIAENLPLDPEDIKRQQARAMEMRNQATHAGKLLGSAYIRQEVAGDVFARLTYVQKFERTAIVWQFVFYKPGDRWFLHAFAWHTNPGVLFDDAPRSEAAR